jgi:hypothetical protein
LCIHTIDLKESGAQGQAESLDSEEAQEASFPMKMGRCPMHGSSKYCYLKSIG